MDKRIEKTIPLWCDTAGLTRDNDLLTQLKVAFSEMRELVSAIVLDIEDEVLDAIVDSDWMVEVCYYLSDGEINLRLELAKVLEDIRDAGTYTELLARVPRTKRNLLSSNFSKFCTTEHEAELTAEKYINTGVPVKYEQVGEVYVVRCMETCTSVTGKPYTNNKILKSINYIPLGNIT